MRLAFATVIAALALPAAASAAVTAVNAEGFRLTSSYEVATSPDKVWAALIEPGRWWNPQHSWFGNPGRDFRLEARPGGCFCESGPDGGAMHMTVTFVKPGRQLNLWGALGPLGMEGAAGGMTVKLDPTGATSTRLTVTYTVGGYLTGGAEKWAPLVDGVLGEQFGRLERYAETGSADAAK
jgi:uncharacterized protein YndB with AHSA1/START domain